MKKKLDGYVKLREAAETLGVSPNTLRNWDRSGKLKAIRHPVNQYRMYRLSDVARLVRETEQLYLPGLQIESTSPQSVRYPLKGAVPAVKSLAVDAADPRFLKRTFRQLSRAFRDSRGGGLLERFEEISKLLFCKLLDEREAANGHRSEFKVYTDESKDTVYKRIAALYDRACQQYPSVFSDDRARLTSDKDAVASAVQILQDINLAATSGDVKGAAYEELIKDTFEKSENQQFFTPRVIVEFMVEFADPSPDMVVCDPACGSGGFLIATLQHVFARIDQESEHDQRKAARKRTFKRRHLSGAEIDRRMAWVAQMNLLMHGDGEGRVFYLPDGGSLAYSEAACKALPDNHFDLILTNPPFGSDFSDPVHLVQYETGKGRTSRRRGLLFVERCLRVLKPNGLLGIILDDGVLSGLANQDIRRLTFREAIVEAVISLPEVAFMPYATAKASILFVRKKPPRLDWTVQGDVFMANVENVGHRPNGDPLYADERDEHGRLQLLNDLPQVVKAWQVYRQSGASAIADLSPKVFVCSRDKFYDNNGRLKSDRLDVLFYHPSRELAERTLTQSIYPTPRLMELVVERNVSTVPSVVQPDETCRYMGLANIAARTGEYEITEVRGDRIKSAVRLFRGGDIIFAKLRPELRKCVFIADDEDDAYASSECLVLRVLDRLADDPDLNDLLAARGDTLYQVDSEYLAYMLRSDIVFGQLVYQCTGVGRPRVPKSAILNVRIPLPPLEIQQQLLATFKKSWKRYSACRKRSQDALREADESLEEAYQLVQTHLCPSR
jgi:type I restriction-modification system DNA methylase subunit